MLYFYMVVIGFLFLIIGIPFLGGAFLTYKSTKKLLTNGIETRGLVVDIIRKEATSTDIDDNYVTSVTYAPKIEFEDMQGHKHTFVSSVSTSKISWEKGDELPIIYDPDHPEKAKIKNFFGLYGLSMILVFMGSIFTFVGLVLLLAK